MLNDDASRYGVAFRGDLERAIGHGLGAEPDPRVASAARFGIVLREGTIHLKNGDRRDARSSFRLAISERPAAPAAWLWMATSMLPLSLADRCKRFRAAVLVRHAMRIRAAGRRALALKNVKFE